jgi:hypothetical protein
VIYIDESFRAAGEELADDLGLDEVEIRDMQELRDHLHNHPSDPSRDVLTVDEAEPAHLIVVLGEDHA